MATDLRPIIKRVPFWKRFLGFSSNQDAAGEKDVGITTPDGATILDPAKLENTRTFQRAEQKLRRFAKRHGLKKLP